MSENYNRTGSQKTRGHYRRRRRRRRFRAGCLPVVFLIILVAGGLFFWSGRRFEKERYQASVREPQLMQTVSVRNGRLSMFAEDLCVAEPSGSLADEGLTCEAGGLFNDTEHTVLCGRNLFARMYPASITKVMTALLALENGNMDDVVTVTDAVLITEPGASMCGIQPGDQISMRELMYGLLLPSGNDAANAIAVHLDGSVEAFAEHMNRRAWELGATSTHFMNPSGLNDDNHYTTAYDLYLIFREAMKQPLFREIIGTVAHDGVYTSAQGMPVLKKWENSNWYLAGKAQVPSGLTALGGKTGTTKAAGSCLIMGEQDGSQREFISVVLKAADRPALYSDMTNIISKAVN